MFQIVGEASEMFQKKWNKYKNNVKEFLTEDSCMKQRLFKYYRKPGQTGFRGDICITLINKTDCYNFCHDFDFVYRWQYLIKNISYHF